MSELLPIQWIENGPGAGVVVVRLEQAGKPVVVLDHGLIRRLEATLAGVPRDTVGLVLASAGTRAFVAGADLKAISEMSDPDLGRYLAYASRVFGMLCAFPFPTCAAINGAALGGGLELAMHCDGLVASPPARGADGSPGRPYPVGLPEAGLKICPGWGGTNLFPARIEAKEAMRRTAVGQPMTFDEAKSAGLFDAVAPSQEALVEAAAAWVAGRARLGRIERDGAPSRWIGRPKYAAAALAAADSLREELEQEEQVRAVLDAVDAGLTRGWTAALETEQRHLIRLRGLPAGKGAIEAFFAGSRR